MTSDPHLLPLCHSTWISHYQCSLLPSLQLHDLWMTWREHSNACNLARTLHFPSHSTQPQHELMGCLDRGSVHSTRLAPPHTPASFLPPPKTLTASVILVIFQLSARNRLRNRPEKKTCLNHSECYVLMKHDGFCNHQGISHKHPFPLMQSWAITLSGSEKQYKT